MLENSETQFRKIPRHNFGKFLDTNLVIFDKTGNRRKRSVKQHADSDTDSDRKFRIPILFSKNTVTDESDRKISKSVSEIPKNSETVFIPTQAGYLTRSIHHLWLGLLGSLIPFAPLAFVCQCECRASRVLSPSKEKEATPGCTRGSR
jgi:hypothetical protein